MIVAFHLCRFDQYTDYGRNGRGEIQTHLVIGAVAALGLVYGVLHFPSAEVAEVRTVAEIDPEIAVLEADQAYLLSEMMNMGVLPTSARAISGEIFPGWQVCGNQVGMPSSSDTWDVASDNALRYQQACLDALPAFEPGADREERQKLRDECAEGVTEVLDNDLAGYSNTAGSDYPPCKALLDEYDLTQQRLDELRQKRVQAQMRERERE